ncbi:MAG: TraR/DksA family transcriptional regulator [Acidimicrobiales bacterium]|nr:TraR/DksA family transcriptional regulator [Acidimicrobiales bacterium]
MATAKKSTRKAAKKVAATKRSTKKSVKKSVKKAAVSSTKKSTAKKPAAKKAVKKAPAKSASTKKPAAKKAVKKAAKSPFGKKFNDEMKERLTAERAKYLHSAEEYRAEADALIEGREPGDVQFDEESGEGDTLAVERERDLALSAQARGAVDQIDAALDRIKAGTYGVCVASGLSIPQERLRAIPWAAERVEYKVGGLGRL